MGATRSFSNVPVYSDTNFAKETARSSESLDGISEKPKPVSWSSLPRKDQLVILTLARLSEPLTQTSLQSYMFYQLRSFSPNAPDSTISYQAGMLQAAFTGAQFCTAIFWGRMADWERMGRKKVILVGLLGTGIGVLGFGFSRSFAVALLWRFLGGGKS
jgi:MFS family permease